MVGAGVAHDMNIEHTPVLLEEAVRGLNLRPGANIIDGTLGSGGHARAILAATAPDGKLMGFDRDPEAINQVKQQLKSFLPRLTLINDSYSQLEIYVKRNEFNHVAGVLLDLGFSSTQLADRTRGFSFQTSGLLDLRYNSSQGQSAAELLNTASAARLEQVFRSGEEPSYRRLTAAIVAERRQRPFRTTDDLLRLVESVKGHGRRSLHPATLVWQALRLEVNDELNELRAGLLAAQRVLAPGGRLAVISFHSGEDRIVKNFFHQESRDCLCPPSWPDCRCGHKRQLKLLTKKVVTPTLKEISLNPRARSAKLRLAEQL